MSAIQSGASRYRLVGEVSGHQILQDVGVQDRLFELLRTVVFTQPLLVEVFRLGVGVSLDELLRPISIFSSRFLRVLLQFHPVLVAYHSPQRVRLAR